jgi:hypothetical protein
MDSQVPEAYSSKLPRGGLSFSRRVHTPTSRRHLGPASDRMGCLKGGVVANRVGLHAIILSHGWRAAFAGPVPLTIAAGTRPTVGRWGR